MASTRWQVTRRLVVGDARGTPWVEISGAAGGFLYARGEAPVRLVVSALVAFDDMPQELAGEVLDRAGLRVIE